MGIVASKIVEGFVAAGANLRLNDFGLGRIQHGLAVSFVTLFRPWFLLLFPRFFTLVGTVRRWWTAGVGGVQVEPRRQFFNLFALFDNLLRQILHLSFQLHILPQKITQKIQDRRRGI